MQARRLSALTAVARHVGTATLAGIVAGILVGGLLGRLVMRVAGFTAGPGMVGAFTANGNRVGDITLQGTAMIIVFVGLAAGLAGGVVYAVVEPWLRRLRPWHGLAYGGASLAAFGFAVLDPANLDFQRFGSAPLNVAMFAALFLLFGIALAWLFDRLRQAIAGDGLTARALEVLAFVSLVPSGIAIVFVLMSLTALAEPLLPVVFVLGLVVATVARWRDLPALVGYTALVAPIVLGAARTIGAVPRILAGF
ncbi:MAG TPA: hypothetical protein VKR80_01410 [Candidatus Limnocylindria bacterium]|nr:hypothetical protein [Candidatus Limnocylindria bacterium]